MYESSTYIDVNSDCYHLRADHRLPPFSLIDNDSPQVHIVGELNEARAHIWNTIKLIRSENKPVKFFISKSPNDDSMSAEAIVSIIIAMVMPYLERQCFDDFFEAGNTRRYGGTELVQVEIGTTFAAEKRVLQWFFNNMLQGIASYDRRHWVGELSWREYSSFTQKPRNAMGGDAS